MPGVSLERQVELHYIARGKPRRMPIVESFPPTAR